MSKNTEWKNQLLLVLSQMPMPHHSPFNDEACRRAVQRVARGVGFFKRNSHTFVGRTQKRDFCMLDIHRDVLSGTGPCWGQAIRQALTAKQRSDYGFDPAVQYFLAGWNELYTALWKKAGAFFAKHRQYGVR